MTIYPVYDYRISNGLSAAAGAGTISATLGLNNVTGVGTAFTTQAHIGDLIISGGVVVGVVSFISTDAALVIDLPSTVTLGGASYQIDPLVNVETLSPPFQFAPKPVPRLWQQDFDLGNGLKRGLGGPSTLWQFGFATQAFRDALRVYCPIPYSSTSVWIRTRGLDGANAYLTYSAAMLWPVEEPLDAFRRVPFTLQFRAMVIL